MRRCPTCQRTFDDNLKFCQADGTPLVDAVSPAGETVADDPFKTVLAPPDEAAEPEFDPMKTMLAPPPSLELPPPSPFGAPLPPQSPPERQSGGFDFNPPLSSDLGSPQFNASPLPSESFPPEPPTLQQQPSGNFGQTPAEPFGQSPSGGFDNAPRTPTFQEPEPPFGQQPNFGAQQPFGQQPTEWTPPPVPQTGWDNQGLGQNTPFNPPPVKAGINQTLPIVSLGLGVASVTIGWCCSLGLLLAPAALITGFIGLSQAKKNPQTHGGRGFAIGGVATGAFFLVIYLLIIVIYGAALFFGNLPR